MNDLSPQVIYAVIIATIGAVWYVVYKAREPVDSEREHFESLLLSHGFSIRKLPSLDYVETPSHMIRIGYIEGYKRAQFVSKQHTYKIIDNICLYLLIATIVIAIITS